MSTYWTNFAKFGDPNGRSLVRWPQYLPESERILNLDTSAHPAGPYHVEQCEFIDSVYDIALP